jgi:trimeric autotransporter adhesin
MTDAAPTIRLPGIPDIVTSNAYDGTVSVLIGNGDGTFQTPVTRPVGIGPAMVAVGDINGDGFPDIVTANFAFFDQATQTEVYGNNDISVLLGNGSGGFTAASGSPVSLGANAKPFAVAVADMNGDGFGDIVVGNYGTSTVTVLKSNGNGTFTAETPVALPTGAGPSYVVTGDFNRDGKTDVITSNFGTGTITVLIGDGTGGLTQKQTIAVGAGPETIALSDINGDGITDLVVTNYNATNVSVLLGNGDGTFRAAPTPTVTLGGAAFGVALGDINGDGKADMVVADFGNSTISVFLGDGSGGFTADGSPIAVGSLASFAAYSVSLADVNGDGKLDMVLSARSLTTGHGEVVVMLGNGNGTFQNPASAAVYQVGGNADYAVVASLEPLTVNENASLVFSGAHGNAITVGDVDGGSSSETVTLSVAHGTLTLGSTTGLTGLTGNGGASLSFSGTIAQLNAALNGLTYTPTAQYHGADAIAVTINDNTGVQPATSSTQELAVLAVNNAPAGTNNTITALEDTAHTFAASDFGFTDPNDNPANNLLAVEITTLPTAGTLKDNGVAVTAGQFVSVADINAGHLVFTPAANVNGTGYAHFTFQVQDDGGTANGGVNLDQSPNTITFNVTPVNDAPVASGTAALALPNTVTALFSSHFDDSADNQPALPGGSAANTLAGIAITGDAANASTQGSWQYSTDGGTTWTNIASSVSATSALILSDTAELRFSAVAGFGGAPGALTAHVIDSSAGNVSTTGITGAALQGSSSAFTGIDIASHDGGTTPVSAGTVSLTAVVPTVTSIHLAGSTPNDGSSEAFTVTFSENVTGVDNTDFTATVGGTVTDTGISVTGSGAVYTVTVNGVAGDGTLRLDLNSSGTGITDAAGNAAGGFTAGDVYTIEHTPPAVTSVGVPANASYIAGQSLDFIAHFSEAVIVTGTPEITLTLDTGGIVDAQYISGSGTSSLTFRYTVVGGEADTNGVAVGSDILLNGGTVKDAATNAAVLTLNSVASTAGVLVDSIPPTVTSAAGPANGTYGAGEVLTLTVNFSENVLVTTGGGTPYVDVTLDTGGTVHAAYIGGSGSNQLTFAYRVVSGNDDTNGIAIGSAISLNGGTIKDAATNAAVLTLNSVASTTGVLVDAIPPTATSINTVDGSPNNLNTEHFTVTFSAPVNGVDASDFTLVGTGTVSGAIGLVSGSGTTWTVTVNSVTGDGTLRLDLNNSGDPITDNFGNTLTAAHTGDQSYTIQHTPPAVTGVTVPANSTYVAAQSLDFTASFSEAVFVTGTPRIAITLDTGGTIYATYLSGSGTNTLRFEHVVSPGEQDLTGITTASVIDLNGGAIKDAAGNAASGASLNLTGEASTAGVDVDAIAPAVSSVSVPSNGTYSIGQDLDFSVNFTKVVTVNTGGGVPYVEVTLDTGGTVAATYLSGTGTSHLVFQYAIASGKLDTNGIAVGANLILNGGAIQDAIGNDIATALNNVASTTGVLVDSIPPTVTSIHTAESSTNNLNTEHFTVTFSTDVSLNPPDTTDFSLHATGSVTGAVASVTAVSGNTYTVTVTGVTGDGTMRLDLNTSGSTITDAFGNSLTAAHTGDQSYTIDHTAPVPPTLALVHDTGVSNSDNITSNPSITYSTPALGDTLLYEVDGGSLLAAVPVFATDGSADGPHTVSVEEADVAGNVSAAASLSFTLDTTAPATPTLALLNDTGISSNDNITSDATITYSTAAPGDTLLYRMDGGSFSTTVPTFSADGLHTITVEEVDVAGNISTAATLSFTFDTIAPVAPTLALAHDTGGSHTDNITSDPTITVTPADSGGTLLYKIDSAGGFSATAPHFATDGSADGLHTVSVEQEDAAGNIGPSASLSFTLDTLAPAAPTLALQSDTGISGTDHITSNPALTYSALAVGDSFLYKADGGSFSGTAPSFATDHSADGVHSVSVEEVDAAGNISAAISLTFTLDTTAPHLTGVAASPGSGSVFAGSTVALTVGFNEAVDVTGGTPTLTLNDGGTAVYDAAATAVLGDASKLVFDYLVSASDPLTPSLAITGLVAHGATVNDLAGNHADLSNVTAAFALMVNESTVPAYTIGGLIRPALELDSSGHIILDEAASNFASTYGTKALYAGSPPSTPYPPVADTHSDFHLI